ncbi:MAG: hypothetical protein A2Y38_24390 [Spirochaetes bacterium GWB1_59_5]|nr:MAG: hypothetical protein A2Y38_24390 [Spirochaetes bacterium GWB1_59_5]
MLSNFIPRHTYAIVSGYENEEIVSIVAGAFLFEPYKIVLYYPKVNPFKENQKITLHLDNRTGMETYDRDLKVYRASVKATIEENSLEKSIIKLEEYELVYIQMRL